MADDPNYKNPTDLQSQLQAATKSYADAQYNVQQAQNSIMQQTAIIAALNADKASTTDPTAIANINSMIASHQQTITTNQNQVLAFNGMAQANSDQINAINSTLSTNYGSSSADTATTIAPDVAIKTIDPNTASSLNPVSSGSGGIITPLGDYSASTYAGQYLSVDNAALVDSNATLTYTQPANISKLQLNAADDQATASWNNLSYYNSIGDNTSTDYQLAKINAMQDQHSFELARDNLEEVSTTSGLSGDALDARAAAFTIDGLGTSSSNLDSNGVDVSTLQEDPLNISGASDQLTVTPITGLDSSLAGLGSDSSSSSASGSSASTSSSQTDKRIRLRFKDSNIYGTSTSVLFPLNSGSGTNGVVFPYTPNITYAHAAGYQQMAPTHANTDYWLYTNTPAVQIQIAGEFTAQNQDEGQYLMAAMHFFRTASKMHFGENDPNAGLPPPVLTLSGYGDFMFNDLDCIMTTFSMELPNSVDYIEVQYNGSTAWVPTKTTLSVTVVVQQTPKKQRTEFSFTDFASGSLLQKNKGWI